MPKIDNKYMGTFKCNDNKNYYFAFNYLCHRFEYIYF